MAIAYTEGCVQILEGGFWVRQSSGDPEKSEQGALTRPHGGGQGGEGKNQGIEDSGLGVLMDVGSSPGLPACSKRALSLEQTERLEGWHGTGMLYTP